LPKVESIAIEIQYFELFQQQSYRVHVSQCKKKFFSWDTVSCDFSAAWTSQWGSSSVMQPQDFPNAPESKSINVL